MKSGININTYTKRTKQAKDNAAISTIAMSIAKKANDPLAKRAELFKAKFWEFKRRVIEKYRARARSQFFARKASGGKVATKPTSPKPTSPKPTSPKTSDTMRSSKPTKK